MSRGTWMAIGIAAALGAGPCVAGAQAQTFAPSGAAKARPALLDLWAAGKTAFGVFVPDENPAPRGPNRGPAVYTKKGGEALATNPLIDFVFLNLEGAYDRDAVAAISEGLGPRGTPGPRITSGTRIDSS